MALLTAICCLVGTAITAFATGTGTEESNESKFARGIVVNERERIPYLYISKEVENQGTLPAPEGDEFTFKLEIKKSDSDPYEDMDATATYQLFDIIQDPNHEHPIPNSFGSENHRIGDFGTFTLKAGQEARFILGNGWNYRVTEDEKTGYRQKTKVVTGIMEDSASSEEFVNVYQGGSAGAELRVEKSVQTLRGNWTAASSPEFLFRLEVKTGSEYEPAENEPYTLERKNGRTTETVTMETDEYGKFTLGAEEAAVFSELPANGVYRVRELTPDYVEGLLKDETALEKLFSEKEVAEYEEDASLDTLAKKIQAGMDAWKAQWPDWQTWWQKDEGLTVREGSTMLAKTELFENSNISFGVSKLLSGNSREEETFTFQLSDGNQVLGNKQYYLYRTDTGIRLKEPVTEVGEDGKETVVEKEILHTTEPDGTFDLKVGQTAIFVGMKPGTGYTVSELNTNYAYKVKTPETGSYSRSVESEPERLIFINEKVPAGLVVSKSVTSESGDVPGEDAFKFILTKKAIASDGTATYQPMAGEPYTVGKNSGVTGEDGSFTLLDKQSAIFSSLPSGNIYRVEEVTEGMKNAVDYRLASLEMDQDGEMLNPDGTPKDPEAAETAGANPSTGGEAQLQDGRRLTFHFTNAYTPHKMDIKILKVDGDGNALSGAEFRLYRNANLSSPVITKIEAADGTVTEQDTYRIENGNLTIPDLMTGTYWLEEVRPPSGYRLLPRPVQLEIVRAENGRLQVSVKGQPYLLEDPIFPNTGDPELKPEADTRQEEVTHVSVAKAEGSDEKIVVTFTVCNEKLYDLPHAGGIGIVWYMIGGVLLMMAAALILYKNNLLRGGNEKSQH